MVSSRNSNKEVFEAEVLESSVIDEGVLKKILLRAGRVIARPALEGFELIMDILTWGGVELSMISSNPSKAGCAIALPAFNRIFFSTPSSTTELSSTSASNTSLFEFLELITIKYLSLKDHFESLSFSISLMRVVQLVYNIHCCNSFVLLLLLRFSIH